MQKAQQLSKNIVQIHNSSKHVCKYCLKEYTRKILYSRHILVCELIHKSRREKTCDLEEYETIPLPKQMFDILLELANKNAILEEKMTEVMKFVNVKKRRFNAVEWLFKNKSPSILFKEFTKKIRVEEEIVQLLIDENMFRTMTEIFDRNETSSITAFSQKANVIYIYDDDSSNNNNNNNNNNNDEYMKEKDTEVTWRRMTTDDFHIFLQNIHRKIVMTICEWYTKNKETLTQNENQMMKYHSGLNKLMSAEFHKETTLVGKLRTYLYNKVKIEIDVVHVELEF